MEKQVEVLVINKKMFDRKAELNLVHTLFIRLPKSAFLCGQHYFRGSNDLT